MSGSITEKPKPKPKPKHKKVAASIIVTGDMTPAERMRGTLIPVSSCQGKDPDDFRYRTTVWCHPRVKMKTQYGRMTTRAWMVKECMRMLKVGIHSIVKQAEDGMIASFCYGPDLDSDNE